MTLDLLGSDQVGIVSRISGLLASLGVNVEELQTELTTAPMSAELLFKARGLLQLPESLAPETLRDELESVAADLMVDLQMQRGNLEDIYLSAAGNLFVSCLLWFSGA